MGYLFSLIHQLNAVGEIVYLLADAEGATAPETLRHPDRGGMGLWKESTDTLRWKFRCSTEDVSLRQFMCPDDSFRYQDRGGA